jgi:hypothetical protein
MHPDAKSSRVSVRYDDGTSALKRNQEKSQRHAPSKPPPAAMDGMSATVPARRGIERQVVVREAPFVERLAYTRAQAAAALGISRSSVTRHVLPFVETIELGSGTRLIPIDELERFAAERHRPAAGASAVRARSGRPGALPAEVVERIRLARGEGRSLAQIARDLNEADTPTAHGGVRWWPSTVRAVLDRV